MKKTVTSKLMAEMALVSSVYYIGFRNLAKKSYRRTGKYLSGMVDFDLADLPYELRRNQNDDYADYDVFDSNHVKDMVKVLGNVIKCGAHTHLFCSALQLAFWYKTPAPEKREAQASTRDNSRGSDAKI